MTIWQHKNCTKMIFNVQFKKEVKNASEKFDFGIEPKQKQQNFFHHASGSLLYLQFLLKPFVLKKKFAKEGDNCDIFSPALDLS